MGALALWMCLPDNEMYFNGALLQCFKLKFSIGRPELTRNVFLHETFYHFTCPGADLTGTGQILVIRGNWVTISCKHCFYNGQYKRSDFLWGHFCFVLGASTRDNTVFKLVIIECYEMALMKLTLIKHILHKTNAILNIWSWLFLIR